MRKLHHLQGNGQRLSGLVLAVLGFFWLAHKAGWIPVHDGGSQLFWPLTTLVVGVVLLCRPRRGKPEQDQ